MTREELDILNAYVSAAVGTRTNLGNPAVAEYSTAFYIADKEVAHVKSDDGGVSLGNIVWEDGVDYDKAVTMEDVEAAAGFQPFQTTNTTVAREQLAEELAPAENAAAPAEPAEEPADSVPATEEEVPAVEAEEPAASEEAVNEEAVSDEAK